MITAWETEVVLWLNRLITGDENVFVAALWLSDYIPWMVCALVLIALWFSDRRETNRERVLLIFLGMFAAFLLVRPFAAALPRIRPMEVLALPVPISAESWQAIINAVRGLSSFPSDQAAFWFALVCGVILYHRAAGVLLGFLMLWFGLIRMAIGYLYPVDFLAGACIGIASAVGIMALRRYLNWFIKPAAQAFEGLPMIAYPAGLILLFDIVQRMTWTMSLLAILFRVRIES